MSKESRKVIERLGEIFGSPALLDLLTYEINFNGDRDQFKEAIIFLEKNSIVYSVDWNHLEDDSSTPYIVKIFIQELKLKILPPPTKNKIF